MENDQYITITELAKILDVSPYTLRRWEKEGKIKSYRLTTSKRRRYKLSEIQQILQPSQGSSQ